jgi:hypothetical protein
MRKGYMLLKKVNMVIGTDKETGGEGKFTSEYSAIKILQVTP